MAISANVTMVHFNMAAKSHHSAPWRVELVFEYPSESMRASMHRGRARMDVCHTADGSRTRCYHHWRSVRYRQYEGRGRRYRVYDMTAAVRPLWSVCYPKPCRFLWFIMSASFLANRTATQYDWLLASSLCPSVCPSVCDAVHCGSKGWCTGLKVVPACS